MTPFDSVDAVFFDLDETLLDYEGAVRLAIRELHGHDICAALAEGIDPDRFHSHFSAINAEHWERYAAGEITTDELRRGRMAALMERCRDDRPIPLPDPTEMGMIYMNGLIAASGPLDGAVELLNFLRHRFPLGFITNGFADVQLARLKFMKLDHCFAHAIYSEEVGAPKPDPAIFRAALAAAGTSAERTLYIGDNFRCDIVGALDAGLRAIWVNPGRNEIPSEYSHAMPDAIIRSIAELIPPPDFSFALSQSTTASSVHDNLAP
ncbi:MAG: HAD-IA family hydrolase [Candidatus Kapaibacterium sp.]